ncbi:hypothetical protein [Endozoicomonas sp.]|uniref:hypothetical protein n=1 Tax=Endozoicomonas sp. TaxID=1892382 RepID=UPI0028853BA7|nr:hypothetical protein [Endozoicomonas sp.]
MPMNGLHKLITKAIFTSSPPGPPKEKDNREQKVKVKPGKATLNEEQKEKTINTKSIKQRVVSIANRLRLFILRSDVAAQQPAQQPAQQINVFNLRESDISEIKASQADVVDRLYNLRDDMENDRRSDNLTMKQLETLQDMIAVTLMEVAKNTEQVESLSRSKVIRMVGNERAKSVVDTMKNTKMNNRRTK